MFISFEGIDSSGKSTQCERTLLWLREQGYKVHLVREPGGTAISERIRSVLLDSNHTVMDSVTELYLFSAARAQLVSEVIAPALKEGETVIADRFYDSTTAYQGYGRGMELDTINRINDLSSRGIVPDVTVFLDIDYEESVRRRESIHAGHDRIEQSSAEFFNTVRRGYLELAVKEKQRYHVIDGSLPIDTITEMIRTVLQERLER